MCIVTREKKKLRDGTESAQAVHQWAKKKVKGIVGVTPSGWQRSNAVITDTSNTMHAVWNLFNADLLKPTYFYHSLRFHGLKLLIKDIVETGPYQEVLKGC